MGARLKRLKRELNIIADNYESGESAGCSELLRVAYELVTECERQEDKRKQKGEK